MGITVLPVTVSPLLRIDAERREPQRKVFRNPRGQKYYYTVVYETDYEVRLFKSADGSSWSNAGLLVSLGSDNLDSCSLAFFEDVTNNRLVVYFVYNNLSYALIVRAFPIVDSGSDLGALLWSSTLETAYAYNPVIEIGRRSGREYLWVVYQYERTVKGLPYMDLVMKGTTTIKPVTTPTWSTRQTIFSAFTMGFAVYSTIAPLLSARDMLVSYNAYSDGYYYFYTDECDWNGSKFSKGVSQRRLPAFLNYLLSSVVDSGNKGHTIRYYYSGGVYWLYYIGWQVGVGFVGSDVDLILDGGVYVSLALGVDVTTSPDFLCAFYTRAGAGQASNVKFKTTPVDVISWSPEKRILDDTIAVSYLSCCYQDNDMGIGVTYTQQSSPYNRRFCELRPVYPRLYRFNRLLASLKRIVPEVLIRRGKWVVGSRDSHVMWTPPRPLQSVSPESGKVQVSTVMQQRMRVKPMWSLTIRRNGKLIYHKKRERDLFVWRGQSIFAYLLSQGAVGTSTGAWYVVASENSNAPDMGDDSGNPDANEFSPLIGTPVVVSYEFEPMVKPSGWGQTYAILTIKGTVTSNDTKTLRKIGIRDNVAIPNRHIVCEDSVVPFNVILGDTIEIAYTVQLG